MKIKLISLSLMSERLLREMSFFMNCSICFVIEVSVRMKSISLLLMSERLLREMTFFMNCSICFVVEVSVRMKSMSLSLMSSFCKFRLSSSSLISERLLTVVSSMLWADLFMIMIVIGVISFLVLTWYFVLV